MGVLRIRGGAPLYGKVKVSGSKNAALPVIFASIAIRGVSEIGNVPDISDVRCAFDILEHLGARVKAVGSRTYIDTSDLTYAEIPKELVRRLRASTYLLSSMLLRFGRADIGEFGGCNFSPRPIDIHLAAIASHGASVEGGAIRAGKLVPSDFRLEKRSVGATVNALILASGIKGKSTIRGCALEPHILTLIDYLRSAGARITLLGDVATVEGAELCGARATVGGDMIEAGSFLSMSVMTGGAVGVHGVSRDELTSFVAPFRDSGILVREGSSILFFGAPHKRVSITTEPYPGFPTDLQPVVAPMLSISGGTVRETVWPGRFGYLAELSRFGVRSRVVGDTAEIFPSELKPADVTAPDLRGGVALVAAALAAEGESIIRSAEILFRGYERLVEKLSGLGAEIEYDE